MVRLETFLLNYKGAVVIVSHDRYFLDRVVRKVVELDRHKVSVFQGNYSDYAVKKAQSASIISLIIFKMVVFPVPLSPIRATRSPRFISKERSENRD